MISKQIAITARACAWAGVAALGAMMLATDGDILGRRLAALPLHGVVELAEVCVLLVAMLGLPESFLRDAQIRIDLIDGILSARALRVAKAVGLMLSVLLLGLFVWHVRTPMLDAREFGDVKYDLGLPVWMLHAAILFAFAASALSCLHALWAELRGDAA